MTRFSAALAGLGAILFGFWVAWRLWLVVGVLESINSTGGGGIGAVSAGLLDVGPEPLIFVAGAAANRLIARWARTARRSVRVLHIVHSAAIGAVLILTVLLLVEIVRGDPTAPTLVLIPALSIPALFLVQLAIMSILLALFAWHHRRPALTA